MITATQDNKFLYLENTDYKIDEDEGFWYNDEFSEEEDIDTNLGKLEFISFNEIELVGYFLYKLKDIYYCYKEWYIRIKPNDGSEQSGYEDDYNEENNSIGKFRLEKVDKVKNITIIDHSEEEE